MDERVFIPRYRKQVMDIHVVAYLLHPENYLVPDACLTLEMHFPEVLIRFLNNMRLITSWVCHNFSRFGHRRVILVKIPHAGLVYQSLYYSGRLVFLSLLTLILLLTIPGGLYLRPRSRSNCSSPSSNAGQLCSF